ncbi:electron transporter, putative [Medicago truncatula]|uniref:Electron transporter, putative n=2 Tax=Medicago truncatula TaxID=3880 RepID=A0A072UKT1_MEDTR|nr:electron transporter, putative [Medicago truncatula]
MSHSYQHSQPQQRRFLSQYNQNQLHQQIFNINIPEKSLSTSTHNFSFFGTKLVSSSSNQHYEDQEEPLSPPCCFNVVSNSKRFMFGSSMDHTQLDHLSSLISPSHIDIRKKKINGLQKKEELEKEVTMLQRLLDQEEKVREILDMVNSRPNGSAISIPNFLPSKMRELLAELVMVENEIAKLESQISTLQTGLKHEQEITNESKSKIQNQGNFMSNSNNRLSTSTITNPSSIQRSSSNVHERMAFETKALHFISKAIKGDYNLNDFSLNEKTGFSKNSVEQKENSFQEDVKFHERITRKNGAVKPPSPMRDPRHPSPKLRERNLDMSLDLPTRSLLDPLLSEENDLKWQPNKLSESIMKCLNFIYVRLLRTSRAMELEKSGPVSRSLHSSLSSRSFRVDLGSTQKPSLMLHKESRQQDPYGIFDSEESIPRDIGPYKNLVMFTSSSMDPKFISSPSSIPLLRKLRILMSNLQTVDLKGLTNQQKLAFWINLYNACIMHGFIQYGVPSTSEKLIALINKATLNIGGNIINAQAIEHFILRKRDASNMKEAQRKGEWEEKESVVRELYGLEFVDPNVTFALCSGTRSSPAVRIYTGDGVTAELEKSKLDYLQASILATSNKRIGFPELLLRNMLDFAVDIDSLVEWVCNQLPTSGTLRKSMVECFRGHGGNVKASTIVEKIPYDYEFQYLLTI